MAGEDTRDLAEALLAVYLQAGGSHQPQRPDLVAHVLDWPAGPIVYGDALSTCYRDGRTRSLLSARHGKSRVLRWFKGAAPDTLMEEKERAAFAALPDLVTAYRGGTGPIRSLRLGMSWTLDLKVAAFFAYRAQMRPRMVIRAMVPRSAILAYFDNRNERELVVNWRRVRAPDAVSVERLAEAGAAREHLDTIAADAASKASFALAGATAPQQG
jgi:hypothetical protein